MIRFDFNGIPIEADLRMGFVVHNQDGSSQQIVHIEDVRIPTPPDGDGGEPLPRTA